MKGGKIDVPKLLVRNARRVVVAPPFGSAIAGKVLHACEDMVRTPDSIPLEPANLRLGHTRTEVRIFAGALHDSAPSRISCNIHHRRKGPIHPARTALLGAR